MKAVKSNKEYTIDETMKDSYRKDGFDIYGDDGELIAYGAGKTVPYETYMAVKNELDTLQETYMVTKNELDKLKETYMAAKKEPDALKTDGEKKTTRGAKA